ncbi:ATP-binding cassette domain-containing protein, partial [Pantoea agglomerans]|uniref:ATP-binding cassette domain-containing protein n=1 Tax=Enterobacter agglomerans TaxID=549 RepID=UPI001F5CC005
KHPVSVLVVISARDTGRVLMLQRRDDPTFWQSVTGSLEAGFRVSAGDIVQIEGPNGAGKTSLLRLLAGLSRPEQGEIRWL